MKKTVILFAFAALLCACEIPFALDDVSDPRFLVECVPACGDVEFDIKVAYAEPMYLKRLEKVYQFNKSDISLEINGKAYPVDKLEWSQRGNTLRTSFPGGLKEGDEISISVSGKSMPTAHASTVVPKAPRIKSLEITKADDKEESIARKFVLKLADDVHEDDHFGMTISVYEDMYNARISQTPPFFSIDTIPFNSRTVPGQMITMSDINNMDLDAFAQAQYKLGGLVNDGNSDGYYPMLLVTGKQFSNNSYTFYVNADLFDFSFMDDIDLGGLGDYDDTGEYVYDVPDDEGDDEYYDDEYDDDEYEDEPQDIVMYLGSKRRYAVEVFRLSDELYNYCKAQYLMDFNLLANFGVTPPNFTYSNVHNGLGVVGGVSRAYTGELQDPFNKEPEMPTMEDILGMLK